MGSWAHMVYSATHVAFVYRDCEMEQEQPKCDRARVRKCKQREGGSEERQRRNSLRKKRYIEGESSEDR